MCNNTEARIDFARPATYKAPMQRIILSWMLPQLSLAVVLLCVGLSLPAQMTATGPNAVQEAQELAAGRHWDEIVRLLGPVHSRTADMDFYYGSALARLDRWPEAAIALQAGWQLASADPRFPIELAGIAFSQKHYPQAAFRLRQAIKLAPSDPYVNNFLGTVYFLDGNLEASLKYWNRSGKPEIANVRENPAYRVSPALLDRAFAFSPAAPLLLPEFLDTIQRIQGLGIFPQHRFDLIAREDGKFDVIFRSKERNGFGDSKLETLFMFLQGLPFQSVNPEFYNWRRDATNIKSLYRWDPQKRRINVQLSGPFESSAKYRYEVVTDLRNENWALRNSFTGEAPVLASLNLRHELVIFDLASYSSERLRWSSGAEFSHRDFRSVVPGAILTSELLATGYQLKQLAQLRGVLWRQPEDRLTVDAETSSQFAHLWSWQSELFEKIQGSVDCRWFPRAEGDDFATRQQFRAGKTIGQAPFDELFMLGLERDNDLPMRAHIGTRDGRKGSAPLGRDYLLTSWETDKNVYTVGVMTIKIGPFLDVGKIANTSFMPGSGQWLSDTGVQAKLRIFGSGLVFSWGRDLRSGNNAFYFALFQ